MSFSLACPNSGRNKTLSARADEKTHKAPRERPAVTHLPAGVSENDGGISGYAAGGSADQ